MEPSVALCIGYQAIAVFVILTTVPDVVISRLSEIILIHKVVACVVRRIYIDHLDFSEIVLTKKLKDIKVVSLDIEVLCVVKVNALLSTRAERLVDWRISRDNRLFFPRPSELVALFVAIYYALGELLLQLVKINGLLSLSVCSRALSQAVGEKPSDFLDVLVHQIWCLHIEFFHISSLIKAAVSIP